MATFFHGGPPEMQADGLQTLYLMNPGYVGYAADGPVTSANMLLFNTAVNSLSPAAVSASPSGSQQQQQQLLGIPLQAQVAAVAAASSSQDPGRPPPIAVPHDVSAVHGMVPRLHYNLWNPSPGSNPGVDLSPGAHQLRRNPVPLPSQQVLSLSLSPQQTHYAGYRQEHDMTPRAQAISPASGGGDDMRILVPPPSSASEAAVATSGVPGLQGVLMGSKYLKATQQLLEEVVNVGKGIKDESPKAPRTQGKENKEAEEAVGEETSSKRAAADLTTAERQEIQMKKAKLVTMLDEVEQRYRQYHHQMQIVVSSFEAIAGFGSARTYTSLALQTISRQFRCLKDAIAGQIRATSRCLGEDDSLTGGGKTDGGGSRLRFVDHHLRRQRELQQLGMMQHNAWRPQRGLPERAVSVLRAWLFEHFLHPYPKDSDKLMLARQTGLTRSQVSNWFINARVRLWKPMVEEMYMEEVKDQEHLHNPPGADDKAAGKNDLNDDSSTPPEEEDSPTRTEQTDSLLTRQDSGDPKQPQHNHHGHHHRMHAPAGMIPTSDAAGIIRMHAAAAAAAYGGDTDSMVQEKLKKARTGQDPFHINSIPHSIAMGMDFKPESTSSNREFFTKFGIDGRPSVEETGYSLFTTGAAAAAHGGGGFGAAPFTMGDIGRFDPEQFAPRYPGNNGVSLTLGLQHCESLSLSGAQPSFLSADSIPLGRRLDMGTDVAGDFCSLRNGGAPSVAHSANAFENINIQNRKGFAAALLPDFVA